MIADRSSLLGTSIDKLKSSFLPIGKILLDSALEQSFRLLNPEAVVASVLRIMIRRFGHSRSTRSSVLVYWCSRRAAVLVDRSMLRFKNPHQLCTRLGTDDHSIIRTQFEHQRLTALSRKTIAPHSMLAVITSDLSKRAIK